MITISQITAKDALKLRTCHIAKRNIWQRIFITAINGGKSIVERGLDKSTAEKLSDRGFLVTAINNDKFHIQW